ncbi:hypothetical protein [Sphingomonas sanxanigenens]|uniref:hypothetical protein n=1 Tax=Sphingomonas sanxanigenens TaxID=397260 RepID=UPI0009FF806D|nr:hypothetical protein [Sphingomonas sanxanigenens]
MSVDAIPDAAARRIALVLVEQCVRNTQLENLHAGKVPDTHCGDYSDVKVVTPFGEIPWNEVSRISDKEMKDLMIEVVNKVYTFVSHMEELISLPAAARWNRPVHDKALLKTAHRRAKERDVAR